MGGVFITTYEVAGEGLEIIERYRAAEKAFLERCWVLVEETGAVGFQPSWSGIRAMLFEGSSADDVPAGWRLLERDPQNQNKIRCAPRKSSKAGRALAERLASVGARPRGEDVAGEFGWSPRTMAIDGNRIFFPTQQSVELPEPRHFVRLPRFEGDGWEGHPGLRAVPESEFMRALEQHNECVRALDKAA